MQSVEKIYDIKYLDEGKLMSMSSNEQALTWAVSEIISNGYTITKIELR